MARTRTFLEMRTEALERAGMEGSSFVTAAEVGRRINEHIATLYDLLTRARGEEYFRTSAALTVNAVTTALPSTFYKLCGLDVPIGSDTYEAKPLDWSRRNDFQNSPGWSAGRGGVYYQIEGANIRWWPTPTATHSVTCWFIPHAVVLTADGDTFDGYNGFELYPIVATSIDLLNKEESDVSAQLAELQGIERRIQSAAAGRSQNEPQRVRDVRRRFRSGGWEDEP